MDKPQIAKAELAEFERLHRAAMECWTRAVKAEGEWTEDGIESPFHTPFNPPSTTGDQRRAHRPGKPRKIDAHPELCAFSGERVDHMTFDELTAAVADTFPPDRRVAKSAIHAWWKRRQNG